MGGTSIRRHLGDLNSFADALINVDSSRQLVEHLEQQLVRIKATPARLFLLDEAAMSLYCARSFQSDDEQVADLPGDVLVDPPDNYEILYSKGDPIGCLEINAAEPPNENSITQLCSLLGPALQSVERQDVSLRELRHLHEEMQQFTSAGELLSHVDVEVLLVRILETIMTAVKAQVGAIVAVDADGSLKPKVVWGFNEEHLGNLFTRDGLSVIDTVFEQQAELCLYGDEVAEHIDLERFSAQLTGLLVLPITGKNTKHGVVVLGNPEQVFNEKVKRIGNTVCDMAAIAMDNALLVTATVDRERLARDLEIAQSVQNSMFPSAPYDANDLFIVGSTKACDETGGDYYTYIEHDDELYTMIGDVTGHGLGAALYTTMAHAIVHQQLRAGVGVQASSNFISTALQHANSERFMTAVLMCIDYRHRQFSYVSAGHNPILWIHDGATQWLDSNGLPLGIMLDVPCMRSKMYDYSPGDYLILYTDGFIESVNEHGEYYGEERLAALMLETSRGSGGAQAMMDALYADVEQWLAGAAPDDDLTMLVIQCRDLEAAAQA